MSVDLNSKLLKFSEEKRREKQALLIKMFLEEEPEEVLERENAWIRYDDYPKIIIGVIKALREKNKGL